MPANLKIILMVNWKYVIGALMAIPLLPIMFIQALRIRAKIPKLPEAEGPQGRTKKEKEADEGRCEERG